MLLLEDKRYYTYIYLDPSKCGNYIYNNYQFNYEPFYIGKGINNRIKANLLPTKSTNFRSNKIISLKKEGLSPIALKVKENLSQTEALNLEIYLIKIIGRRDLNKGPLTNQTDGGDGTYNMSKESKDRIVFALKNRSKELKKQIGEKISKTLLSRKMHLSEEHKRKISNSNKGKKLNENQLRALSKKGKKFSEEHKNKIKKSNMNKIRRQETINKLIKSNKRRKGEKRKSSKNLFNIYFKYNNTIIFSGNRQEIRIWCIENKISQRGFYKTIYTKEFYKNFLLGYKDPLRDTSKSKNKYTLLKNNKIIKTFDNHAQLKKWFKENKICFNEARKFFSKRLKYLEYELRD